MKSHRKLALLAVLLSVNTWACDRTKTLPLELLGKEFNKISHDFISITTDGGFVDEFGEREGDDSRALVIDKDRHYFTVHTRNDIIISIYIEDNCIVTSKNVRVGDSFSIVRAAYPDATYRMNLGGPAAGEYDLVTNDGQVEFWFNEREIKDMIWSDQNVEISDEIVQKLKVWVIHLQHSKLEAGHP